MHAFTKLFVVLSAFETAMIAKRDERGATAVEYALVIGLASIVIVGALAAFAPALKEFIDNIDFGSAPAAG